MANRGASTFFELRASFLVACGIAEANHTEAVEAVAKGTDTQWFKLQSWVATGKEGSLRTVIQVKSHLVRLVFRAAF